MKVLILCTGNSCRSQMAQAFLQSFDKSLKVYSAGTDPAKSVNPFAIQAMKEVGIDISQNTPKHFDQFLSEEWDYVITVCGGANETCPTFIGKVKNRWHLGYDDPTEATGTDKEKLVIFRRVRDEINEGFKAFYTSQILGKHGCSCGCK